MAPSSGALGYGWRVYVILAGGTRMHLCTCEDGTGVAAVVAALTCVDRPQFYQIEIELEVGLSSVD